MNIDFWLQIFALTVEILGIALVYIELRHADLSRRINTMIQSVGRLRDWEISKSGFYFLFFGALAIIPSIYFISLASNDSSGAVERINLYLLVLAVMGLAVLVRSFGKVIIQLDKWSGNRGIGVLGIVFAATGFGLQTWEMF